MKLYKIFAKSISIISVLLLCAAICSVKAANDEKLPKVSAASAVVYDAAGQKFYYKKQSDVRRPMASTTKIMTAVIALENGNLNDTVKVSREAAAIEGSRMYLSFNEEISLKDLLYGLMLSSGNDAAAAIAGHIGNGSVDEFVGLMNDKADELGLINTHFENPSGLDGQNHYTTAEELAVIAAYALKNPQFREIVSCKTYKTETGGHYLSNHNKMLRLYDCANGVKTGFTKKSGRCLVSSAEKNGRQLIAVTLNAPDDWNDHINMLDYGFSLLCEKYEIKKDLPFRKIPVAGKNSVPVYVEKDIDLSLTNEEKENLKTVIIGRKFIYPPVKKGNIYGQLILNVFGSEYARINLIYGE